MHQDAMIDFIVNLIRNKHTYLNLLLSIDMNINKLYLFIKLYCYEFVYIVYFVYIPQMV